MVGLAEKVTGDDLMVFKVGTGEMIADEVVEISAALFCFTLVAATPPPKAAPMMTSNAKPRRILLLVVDKKFL